MKAPKQYATPEAFKRALEDRIREAAAREGMAVNRFRQRLIFDRFLARIATELGDAATAKGGVALELRLGRARTTRDVDLRMTGSPEDVLDQLQRAGRVDLGDFLAFTIALAPEGQDVIEGAGIVYEGVRFRAEATLAGRLYGDPFGVDAAFGDVITGEVEEVPGSDFLAFAGIAPPRIRIYPRETHIAEKLHAYTLPRKRPNSRVKDLPDIALLANAGALDGAAVRNALERTFSFRASHPLPSSLSPPPAAWAAPYARMAEEDHLRWRDLAEVSVAAASFINPVLSGSATLWDPARWEWAGR